MSTRQPARPRRIDDALSQLVDSLTPPLSFSDIDDGYADDAEEALAAAEERRHQDILERSWRILDTYTSAANNDPSSPPGPGINRRGSLAGGENINNASDLIKRKLLRENASPDKAVRFSNLYSRLLTQPVLSQKWAILYLLYRLSGADDHDGFIMDDEVMLEARSPPVEPANLQNVLWKGQRTKQQGWDAGDQSDEEGPAISSSASQLPGRIERKASVRRQELFADKEREAELDGGLQTTERPRETRVTRSRANTGVREPFSDDQKTIMPDPGLEKEQKPTGPLEDGLLRDLPFNLQGLSSSNLQFSSSSILKLPPSLPLPVVSLLNSLAEPCLLYRGLSSFVESSGGGLLSQSLRAALSNELRSYLGLVATLEGEIRRALAAPADPNDPRSASKSGVTLKRCVVWTRDATMALRLMSLIVEEAQSMCSNCERTVCKLMLILQTRKVVN